MIKVVISGYGRMGHMIEAELKRPENHFMSLRDNALLLVLEGITTMDEVLRVIHEE